MIQGFRTQILLMRPLNTPSDDPNFFKVPKITKFLEDAPVEVGANIEQFSPIFAKPNKNLVIVCGFDMSNS